MKHSFIYASAILMLAVSCETPLGKGSTVDAAIQTTVEREIDNMILRDSTILNASCMCLENGAILAEYGTRGKNAINSIGSMFFPGDILTPVIRSIASDSIATEGQSIDKSDLYGLLSTIKTIIPESDCLVPANLSLPAELEKARQSTLQGRCHKVSEADICAAYDCIAHLGLSYAPFRDYGAAMGKRIVCSEETAAEVIRSIEYRPGQYSLPCCLAYGTTQEKGYTREIAVFFTVSKNPVTTILSLAYPGDHPVNDRPSDEMMTFFLSLPTYRFCSCRPI